MASDTHLDPRLSRLRAPAVDADELARVLSDPDIGAFDVAISLNEAEHVVRRRLSTFFDDRALDDLLVLHLSCHGVKDEDGRLYFATSDTEVQHLDATAIPADYVNRQMSRCRSRRIVLLLDCCYSGAFARGMVGRGGDRVDLRERFEGRGRIVLTASSAMEYSFEGDDTSGIGRPSVFTAAVVDGLATGEADRDGDGYISVDELYDFAFERVRAVTPSQTPGKWVFDVQGDFYLARSPAGASTTAPGLPADLIVALASPFARVRRGAAEELARLLSNPDEELVALARAALVELTRDDSQDVSRAAHRHLEGPALTSAVTPGDAAPAPVRPDAGEVPAPVRPSPEGTEPAVVPRPAAPGWLSPGCRVAAIALLGAVPFPLGAVEELDRWNVFAVMAPFAVVLASVLAWRSLRGLQAGRLSTPFVAGSLLAVGALTTAGGLGLIIYPIGRSAVTLMLAVVALVAALALLGGGFVWLRTPSGAPEAPRTGQTTLVLAVLAAVLTTAALFVPYDGLSSLWTEIIEGTSAAFAYLPLAAILVMVTATLLLPSRTRVPAGLLSATGALVAAQFVGILIAASFAVGEAGDVRPGWAVGVVGGTLAAVAGWQAQQAAETPV